MSPAPPRQIGLALSGGGARAMAFHLGCLRALHDRGILEQVRVLSTVSGGSVIGAMYAYSDDDFEAFDARVVNVLRRGLAGSILSRVLSPTDLVASFFTSLSASVLALGADILRVVAGRFSRRVRRMQPPLRRWHSRTTSFERSLDALIFGKARMSDVKRRTRHGALDVFINATELRTGTAFRFASDVVGSRRHGTITAASVPVSLGVAASAAYPVFLPALDCEMELTTKGGETKRQRVLLTDGGVYDNLGTAPMEPDRDPSVSAHIARPDYIIACDAGAGVVEGKSIPYWWLTRMTAAFETVFRRVQNDTRNRLHRHASDGRIKGMVMPYLGQDDARLPWAPPDLVARRCVIDYPTDFSPMSEENVRLLTRRGEQLTRVLLMHYMHDI
ncbi:patatin-like phospholipase family protein [Sandaracinus amylolyticus]|uniref:patatin-like phospholipase family protein n=1 Tax=Sandaracinus amylolyticus TaxID=927083 RepID=UPI003B82CBCC